MNLAFRVEDLKKEYVLGGETVHALRGVTIEVPEGDYVAIMGPSGSGKSTLLNLLGCLDRPTSGRYFLGGDDVARMTDDELSHVRASRIGFVFQSYNLIAQLTVVENIEVPLYYGGRLNAATRARCLNLADMVGLGKRLGHRPTQLSGGQQQRAAIARSLVNDPYFILADEPTGNLDSVTSQEILDLLARLNRDDGRQDHHYGYARRGCRRSGAAHHPAARRPFAIGRAAMTVWIRTWQLGVKSLLLHPLRSLLTVLGIFIGVASVIWLLAIGEGISRKAQEQIEGLGADNIIIRSVKPPAESLPDSRGPTPYGLLRDDYYRLTETIGTIERALPIRELRRQFRHNDRLVDGRLVGCTPEFAQVTHLEVDRGHFISDADLEQKEKTCALAAEVAERLFPFENPLGQSVKIEEDYYVVVGVMKPRESSAGVGGSLAAQDYTDDIYIPISTLWSRIGDFIVTRRSGSFEGEIVQLSQITLRVDKVDNVIATSDVVRNVLASKHRISDYAVTVPLDLLEQAKTTRLMFIVFMGLIAAISLLVGGIGIMNIMLATVTERTREIGIRRALGAKRGDITRQFLAENHRLVGRGRSDRGPGRPDVRAGYRFGPCRHGILLPAGNEQFA